MMQQHIKGWLQLIKRIAVFIVEGKRRWIKCCIGVFLILVVFSLIKVNEYNTLIVQTFDARKNIEPARVYAQPLQWYVGQPFSLNMLLTQLKVQGYQRISSSDNVSELTVGRYEMDGNTLSVYIRGFQFPDGWQSPEVIHIAFENKKITGLTNKDNKPIALARLEPELIGTLFPMADENRIPVVLKDVPSVLVSTLLTTEDRNFFNEWAVSFKGMARALVTDIKAGHIVEGGSTLTQQLVKNFFLTNKRTFHRKLEEVVMAFLLEFHYTKEQILQTYINEVYLGQDGGQAIHGFALASEFYFARPLKELSLPDTALLVGMVKGPSYFNPRRYPERALARRNLILDLLAQQKMIFIEQAAKAKKSPLGIVAGQVVKNKSVPAYMNLVKRQLLTEFSVKDLSEEGLRIFSNMEPLVQSWAQRSVLEQVHLSTQKNGPPLNGGMVVTDVHTGSVLAVVGGARAGFAGFNHALDIKRSIGSLVKPAVYLTALLNPSRYTLATLIPDEPVFIRGANGQVWSPRNDDRRSHGDVPLYKALSFSYNQATARLGMQLGLASVIDTLKKLGLSQTLQTYPSLLLGAFGLSPFEVAKIYQTIASGGYQMPLQAISTVINAKGEPLRQTALKIKQVFSKPSMALLQWAMEDVMKEGTGRSAYQRLPVSVITAGKTGTSEEGRDSWFAGFSGNIIATVWIGSENNQPAGLYGATAALRAWRHFMAQMPLVSLPSVLEVHDIRYHWIDPVSGLLGKGCENQRLIPFLQGSVPNKKAQCADSGLWNWLF